MFELAFLVGALREWSRLEEFFDEIRAAAIGTFLHDGLAPRNEIALRITVAAEEGAAAFRSAFHHLAFGAVRARHANGFLLNELAFRVVAARHEFAIAAKLLHQVAIALRAFFFERNVFTLLAANLFGRLAIGVARAGEECSEASLLEDHRTPTVFAIFGLVLFAEIAAALSMSGRSTVSSRVLVHSG